MIYQDNPRNAFGIGETVLDIIFKQDQPQAANPGGSVFNSMTSLGRAGIPATFISQTGDDHVGELIVNFLRRNGVCPDFIYRQPQSKSHISLAFLDENNDAHYQFYKDHASVQLTQQFPDVQQGDVVMFGSFFAINPVIRKEVARFMRRAKERGAIIYYDINFRKPHLADLPQAMPNLLENLALSDVVRGSADDFEVLYGVRDSTQVYQQYIQTRCPLFICTDGAQAIHVHTPGRHLTFPVQPLQTVSTVGAGDNFNAGFVYGLFKEQVYQEQLAQLDDEGWSTLVEHGQRFSRLVCQSLENYIPVGSIRS